MHPAFWELFRIKVGPSPSLQPVSGADLRSFIAQRPATEGSEVERRVSGLDLNGERHGTSETARNL